MLSASSWLTSAASGLAEALEDMMWLWAGIGANVGLVVAVACHRPGSRDDRPILARILSPAVPWFIAVPCNMLAGAALAVMRVEPQGNLEMGLALLLPAA